MSVQVTVNMNNTQTLIVLFNLKKDILEEDYEQFARNIDFPLIKRLASNRSFKILKATGLFGTSASPPYQYIEVMEVSSFEDLAIDIEQPHVQSMLSQFSSFADNPQLILTSQINN